MHYYDPGPPTGTGRVHRIIRDLFAERLIIGDELGADKYHLAFFKLHRMREIMQEWEDAYIKFLEDPRRRSENEDERSNYISDVCRWYYTKVSREDKVVTPRLRQMWTDGKGIGITETDKVGELRLQQMDQQWSILKEFNDNFCTTAEDLNLLNPTAMGADDAFDGKTQHRLSKQNIPGLTELGITGVGVRGVRHLWE